MRQRLQQGFSAFGLARRERRIGGDHPVVLLLVRREIRPANHTVENPRRIVRLPLRLQRRAAQNLQCRAIALGQALLGHLLRLRMAARGQQQAYPLQAIRRHTRGLFRCRLRMGKGIAGAALPLRLRCGFELRIGVALPRGVAQRLPLRIALRGESQFRLPCLGLRLLVQPVLDEQVGQQALVVGIGRGGLRGLARPRQSGGQLCTLHRFVGTAGSGITRGAVGPPRPWHLRHAPLRTHRRRRLGKLIGRRRNGRSRRRAVFRRGFRRSRGRRSGEHWCGGCCLGLRDDRGAFLHGCGWGLQFTQCLGNARIARMA